MTSPFRRFHCEDSPLDTLDRVAGLLEMITAIEPDNLNHRSQATLNDLLMSMADLLDDARHRLAQ